MPTVTGRPGEVQPRGLALTLGDERLVSQQPLRLNTVTCLSNVSEENGVRQEITFIKRRISDVQR